MHETKIKRGLCAFIYVLCIVEIISAASLFILQLSTFEIFFFYQEDRSSRFKLYYVIERSVYPRLVKFNKHALCGE
jgi:hypothetical protein